ncbi:MAG: mycothiol system anti-sigma-R factor [candidate division Zixibacteria bacterium]|nr:mycothiol system anti-sigma-R factor [candidate division Zixibacteria bacterium]
MIDCKQALLKLNEYLDGELTPEECVEVKEHLESCRHCFSKAEFERIMSKVVREKACKDEMPIFLKSTIMTRIRQIESVTDLNGEAPHNKPPLSGPFFSILSIAAIALLFIAAIFSFTMEGSAGTPGYFINQFHALPDSIKPEGNSNDDQIKDLPSGRVPNHICDNTKILRAGYDTNNGDRTVKVIFSNSNEYHIFYCIGIKNFNKGQRSKDTIINDRLFHYYTTEDGCTVVFTKRDHCYDAVVGHAEIGKLASFLLE